jgi:hypothetical protein
VALAKLQNNFYNQTFKDRINAIIQSASTVIMPQINKARHRFLNVKIYTNDNPGKGNKQQAVAELPVA